MARIGTRTAAAAAAVAAAAVVFPCWATDGTLQKVPLVELEIRPLHGSPEGAPERLALIDERPGSVDFDCDWPGVGRVRVELEARSEASGSGRAVKLDAQLTLPGGRRVQASRRSQVDERGTILFELYRERDRPFTLAIAATESETWEVVRTPSVGEPVRFEVEVMRLAGSTRTSLERNLLQTFENQTVRYEFKLGLEPTDDALTLRLTPVRVVGELIEIRVNLEGRVSDGDEVTVIGREDTMIVSRGQATPVDAVSGDPPTGYRFELTARF